MLRKIMLLLIGLSLCLLSQAATTEINVSTEGTGVIDAPRTGDLNEITPAKKESGNFFYNLGGGLPRSISPNGKYIVGNFGIWENKGNGDNTVVRVPELIEFVGVNDAGIATGTFNDTTYQVNEVPIRNGGVYKDGVWYTLGLGRYGNEPAADRSGGTTPYAITADGWVFGMSSEKNNVGSIVPMRWKPDATGQYTDTLVYRFPEWDLPVSARILGSAILAASADGSTVCGRASCAETEGPYTPIIWTSPTEYKIFDYKIAGEATRISPNGKYITVSMGGKAGIYDVKKDKLTIFGMGGTGASAVSNDGIVVGYRATSGGGRKGFVWSEQLGYVELKEFIERFAPDITLPDGFKFDDPESSSMQDTPMSISADGLIITGFRGVAIMRQVWVIVLAAPAEGLNRPKDLVANVDPVSRNEVELSWSKPTNTSSHSLDYYFVYRNGERVAQVDAKGEHSPSYIDKNAPAGYLTYSVSAVYDYVDNETFGESGNSESAVATVVDTYDLPFYDGFEEGYSANYWTTSKVAGTGGWSLVRGGYNNPFELSASFLAAGDGTSYLHLLTSKPLDGRGKDKITVSFLYEILSEATLGVRDTVHLEISTDAYATTWNTVKSYVLGNFVNWTPQSLDISPWAKDKLFRIRFRGVSGENRTLKGFDFDEFSVSTSSPNSAQGVKARKKDTGEVEVIWQEPSGSYGLTYAKTSYVDSIGNVGVPFIAANRFKADTLQTYKDLKLTSISAFIYKKAANATVDTKLGLAVFVDGVRVVTQEVEHFDEDAWNTFPLNTPIELSSITKELAFGIEVIEHDSHSLPLATDWDYTVTGYGDAFTEDNGKTWRSLSKWGVLESWCIIGNVRSEKAAVERTYGIAGYEIYRDGTRLVSELGLTYEQAFIDNTTLQNPCYTVKAYYTMEGFAEDSEVGCATVDNGVKTVSARSIAVYPNPTAGMIYIQSKEGKASKITVSNLLGEQLLHTTGNSIDLSNYANGIYLLQIDGETFKVMKK